MSKEAIVKFTLAGALVFMCVSCASLSQPEGVRLSGGGNITPQATPLPSVAGEKRVETGVSLEEGIGGASGNKIVVEDMRPGLPAGRKPAVGTGVAATDANGVEENISFRDLPGIRIDEKALARATTVGHDVLIERELRRLLREFGEDRHEVETIFLNEVKLYVKAFRTNDQYRRFMNSSLRRSARYMPAVKEVFRKRNIPEDMAFIAFLESGFNPNARSRAGALGMWQFMPGTARQYSLRVSTGVDERLDPVKSTFAAVEYFHDLVAIFGPRSFLLALAAYNAGEGRIIGCLKKIDNPMEERNFWHIRTCLARETREYPPKVIAAAVIGSNPEVFGFPRYEGNGESTEIRTAFTNFRSLEETPPEVRLSHAEPARRGKTGGKAVAHATPTAKKALEPKPIVYVVKKNNTIATVTDIFRVEKGDVKKWNKLKTLRLTAGQRLKIYPPVQMEVVNYKVRKGDTITEICQSFRVRPASLIATNGLKDGWTIKQGQMLVVYRTKGKTTHRA